MNDLLCEFIRQCDAKALGTYGPHGINVAPVSTIKVFETCIWLFDYFMEKTTDNILHNNEVSLSCWHDLEGYQLKGTIEYCTTGKDFEEATQIVKELHPDRYLKGLLVFIPTHIYSLTPGENSRISISSIENQ